MMTTATTTMMICVVCHNASGRTGVLVGWTTRSPVLALAFMGYDFFSLFVGWGPYFTLNHGGVLGGGALVRCEVVTVMGPGISTRVGVFDWLVGEDSASFTSTERWVRGFVGMSLRGLVWTMPPGLLLFCYSMGWQYMMSGVAMVRA
jgi:hypothetical protein